MNGAQAILESLRREEVDIVLVILVVPYWTYMMQFTRLNFPIF